MSASTEPHCRRDTAEMDRHTHCLLVGLVAVFAFCGCAEKREGFFVATLDSSDNPWRTQMRNNMQKVIDEYRAKGLVRKYAVFSANNDATVQGQQLDLLVSQGVDLVCINPVSAASLNPAIDRAAARGVVVMGIDQTISHPEAYNFTTDQREWARLHAEWLIDVLGGEGKILRFDGIAGAPANEERAEVWDELLAAAPGIEVLKTVNHDWNNAKAKQLMGSLLPAFPEFDGILNMESGPAIYAAMVHAGHKVPKAMVMDESVEGVRVWYEHNREHPDEPLTAQIVENPPGVGANGLLVGLQLLQGKRLKPGVATGPHKTILYKPKLVITAEDLADWHARVKGKPDSEMLDSVLTTEEVQTAYFE